MDHFLEEENCFERLLAEYRRHGKLIVAYDFDDTVYDYHQQDRSYAHVVALLKRCKELGFHLTVFTDLYDGKREVVTAYLAEYQIPYDGINETPDFVPFGHGGKPYYNILLDDRAGLPSAYSILLKVVEIAEAD